MSTNSYRVIRKLRNILNGWYNYYSNNPDLQKLAFKRALICSDCSLNINGYCSSRATTKATKDFQYYDKNIRKGDIISGCACPIDKKVFSENDQCPKGAW